MSTGKQAFLTNAELIAQLSLRNDLTDLEQQLLDRLILAVEEVTRLEADFTPVAKGASAGDLPGLSQE